MTKDADSQGPQLSAGLGRVTGWQEVCSRCKHLLRSGDDGNVWRCAVVRVGAKPAYAVIARADLWQKTAPHRGKCGRTARLFEAA